jgi:hypothetical protein
MILEGVQKLATVVTLVAVRHPSSEGSDINERELAGISLSASRLYTVCF